jgi:hypothetical protein
MFLLTKFALYNFQKFGEKFRRASGIYKSVSERSSTLSDA